MRTVIVRISKKKEEKKYPFHIIIRRRRIHIYLQDRIKKNDCVQYARRERNLLRFHCSRGELNSVRHV